jgi:glycosyltransferase involved in cell wall biosynthesis
MRVLVVNYAMDDLSPVLAWPSRVVQALAQHCERLFVLTEHAGAYALPENVVVEEISQPQEVGRFSRYWIMNRHAARAARLVQADVVFIHMAHRYAYLLYPAFRALGLPILLWYAHGSVTWHLRLAHWCANRVVTSTPEGFQLPSQKLYCIGQGIDTDLFKIAGTQEEPTHIITVSRISSRKRIDRMIDVMRVLKQRGSYVSLKVVGAALTDPDREYESRLVAQITEHGLNDQVEMVGSVVLNQIPELYSSVFLHLNLSETNSMDKSVMEALACGCPVLTSNPAFREVLADFPELMIEAGATAEQIADEVQRIFRTHAQIDPHVLRNLVIGKHDLQSYARRIIDHLYAIQSR